MPRNALLTVAILLISISTLQGCVGFYRYQETQVKVVDAATGEPVEGIPVRTSYHVDLPGIINMPRVEQTATDADGLAVVNIASWIDWRGKFSSLYVGHEWFGLDAEPLKKGDEWETSHRPPMRVSIVPYR